jgi:Phasin protein
MDARRSEQPAKPRRPQPPRPMRRSMAEFAASLQSGAVVQPSRQPDAVAPLDEAEGVKLHQGRKAMISGQTQEAQYAAVTRLRPPEDLDGCGLKDGDDRVSQQLEEATLAAAKAARDCRFQLLDDVKVNVGAARDGANRPARAPPPPDIAGATEGRLDELEEDRGAAELERQLPAPAEAIEQYRAKAIELMNANVNATLDYARRLAEVRSPAEFVAVSARHACGISS